MKEIDIEKERRQFEKYAYVPVSAGFDTRIGMYIADNPHQYCVVHEINTSWNTWLTRAELDKSSQETDKISSEEMRNRLAHAMASHPTISSKHIHWHHWPGTYKLADIVMGVVNGAEVAKPETHDIVAGALYDFAGFLTSRDTCIAVGSAADSAPVANLVKEFIDKRGVNASNADVKTWNAGFQK